MDVFEEEAGEYAQLARLYLDALLRVERDAATRMIIKAVEQGTSVKDIYIHVFEPAQHEVGRLWQRNKITVAEEHFCTAATQMIMSQLYPYIFQGGKRKEHRLVATCVEGEMHEIGVRMVADLLEMAGWDTYYLGANTPLKSILDTLKQLKPDLLAVSAAIHFNIPAVKELIETIHSTPNLPEVKILVGGRPFNLAPDLWKKVGADGCAVNAENAVELAEKLVQEGG